MGRVKTSLIKRVSLKLLEGYRERFVSDFKSNKEVVKRLIDSDSVKLKNSISGYITRLVRRGSEEKRPYVQKKDYEIQG